MVGVMCYYCREDIDKKNQDNMSEEIGYPKCEDCHYGKPKPIYKSNYKSYNYKSNYSYNKKQSVSRNAGGGNRYNAGGNEYSNVYNYIHGKVSPY